MTAFVMPSLGADMESGKLVEWRVKPGDSVHSGDIIAVVETHKGAIEIEVFEDAVVEQLRVQPGETVPVGATLAELTTAGSGGPASPAHEPPRAQPAPALVPTPVPTQAAIRTPAGPGRVKVSPVARRVAARHGIDPETLTGTGIDHSVTLADVELARARGAGAPGPEAAPAKPARPGGFDPVEMRKAIATAMARSKREIPHYYLSNTVDLTPALDWLTGYNAQRSPAERLLPAVLFLKASARALKKYPQLNGFWQDGGFQPGKGVHVGWAVSLRGGGLVAPAIHDADTLALPDLMDRLRDVVARARSGGLRSSELMDPSVTITSLGERGADSVTGVIYPPQVAILGFGRVRQRPWVVGGAVAPRALVDVSLAADHRASDGHTGGLLLSMIEKLLGEPETL